MAQRVAYVTGGMGGIGTAICRRLHKEGHTVIAGCGPSRDHAKWLAEQKADGYTFYASVGNVADWQSTVDAFSKAVAEHGAIDILVNNAGSLVMRRGIRELSGELLDEVFALNVKSAVLASQAVAQSMIDRRCGAIVNIVSIAGHTGGGPGAGVYAAAKAALTACTKSLAKELAPHGIRVNAVSPGVIATPFHDTFSTPEMMRNFAATIPLGRVGTPVECATVIAFLASNAASFIVGETIEVNGGQLMR
jgi:acetoacetyl-CoA reductase